MAPEMYLAPTIPYSFSSDWFSVGVVLHELITGFCPFPQDNFKVALSGVSPIHCISKCKSLENQKLSMDNVTCQYQDMDSISLSCKDFITQLLQVNPASRLGGGGKSSLVYQEAEGSQIMRQSSIQKLKAREGFEEIRNHSWLFSYDWKGLEAKTLSSPLVVDTTYRKFDAFSQVSTRVILATSSFLKY